jgi:hypothetical protein
MGRGYTYGLLAAFALVASAQLSPPARTRAPSPCASDARFKDDLYAFLSSVVFLPDSSDLTFAERGHPSDLRRHARRVTSAHTCQLAHRAFFNAIGAETTDTSVAKPGTVAAVRIGSYYLIAEPENYVIVLTTRDWRVLGIIGFDND